jgi:hypothetical protein
MICSMFLHAHHVKCGAASGVAARVYSSEGVFPVGKFGSVCIDWVSDGIKCIHEQSGFADRRNNSSDLLAYFNCRYRTI